MPVQENYNDKVGKLRLALLTRITSVSAQEHDNDKTCN